ncbi:MAG TPA: hypothetical protein VLV54_13470 [Thermoanaerobaculia bacterium]|nr:hypothetical protein [Thermoanaerobaculia bacterium]
MFESFEEGERSSGLKGFLARHFGPVVYLDLAEAGIRQIGVVFMVLSALTGVVGLVAFQKATPLVGALILAFIAFMLYLTKSRTSAVFLLAFSLLNALLTFPAILPWVWVLFSARAIQLTFGYVRLKKMRVEVLTALE